MDEITDPKKIVYRPLEVLFVPAPWYKNRVILIGDAVHATIPQLGQGAALCTGRFCVSATLLQKEGDVKTSFRKIYGQAIGALQDGGRYIGTNR